MTQIEQISCLLRLHGHPRGQALRVLNQCHQLNLLTRIESVDKK